MRMILTLTFIATISSAAFSQVIQETETGTQAQAQTYSYAYISIVGKLFSKKLKVEVDLGDTPEQVKAGEEFSEFLTNKKSYAAILNHMVENKFELVETLDYTVIASGSGGTSGIVFIMRKEK